MVRVPTGAGAGTGARPVALRVAAPLVLAGLLAGCGGGGDGGLDPADFAGTWSISLVVGAVEADPGADPAAFPGDGTFRERWRIEDCDDDGCILRRPDGGFLFGDLDGVRLEVVEPGALDGGTERFEGTGLGAAVAPPEHPEGEGPEDPAAHALEEAAAACAASGAQRWTVRISLGVRDGVLSGTAFRTPEASVDEVDGTTCYGLDLTLGLSGVPAR